jgi:hypothetical protein
MAIQGFEAVKELGFAIAGVVAGTSYGAPALKLNGKLVACVPVNKSAEANSLMVHIDVEHRTELLRQQPDTYYITEHYAPHPTVLVRLSKITRTDLKELLGDACRFVSSRASKAPNGRPSGGRLIFASKSDGRNTHYFPGVFDTTRVSHGFHCRSCYP